MCLKGTGQMLSEVFSPLCSLLLISAYVVLPGRGSCMQKEGTLAVSISTAISARCLKRGSAQHVQRGSAQHVQRGSARHQQRGSA
jgi:hypothetical protein